MATDSADKALIHQVVRNYIEGMVFADEPLLRQAFHPSCRIIGHYHKELEWLSLDDFIAAINSDGPAAYDATPFWQVISVDITGDAAVVKVIDDYVGMRFTDYLSLLKVDDRWVIINKLYFHHE